MYSLNFVASGELINPYTDRKNKNTLIIYKSQLELGDYILVAHVRETAVFTGDIWVEKKVLLITICMSKIAFCGYILVLYQDSNSLPCAYNLGWLLQDSPSGFWGYFFFDTILYVPDGRNLRLELQFFGGFGELQKYQREKR